MNKHSGVKVFLSFVDVAEKALDFEILFSLLILADDFCCASVKVNFDQLVGTGELLLGWHIAHRDSNAVKLAFGRA